MSLILLIAGQSQQRTQGFQSACAAQQAKLAAAPVLKVISYEAIIRAMRTDSLADLLGSIFQAHQRIFIKLDAPAGETLNWQLVQLANLRKQKDSEKTPAQNLHGELAYQHLFYAGFCHLLEQVTAAVNDASQQNQTKTHVGWLNHPDDIKVLCDKWQCTHRLAQHGVLTPQPLGLVHDFDSMTDLLTQHQAHQVFIKSRFGSSGAGILAYRDNKRGQQVAYTNAKCAFKHGKWRVFNTLKPQRMTDKASIARLVNALAVQGAYVEKWVPKPQALDRKLAVHAESNNKVKHFDVRMVCFEDQARQRLARISAHPLTNLHLGNERMGLDALLSADSIRHAEHCVSAASKAFPHSAMIGFDAIIRPEKTPCIIEANAFGDLLINQRWQGNTTWDDQVGSMLQKLSP